MKKILILFLFSVFSFSEIKVIGVFGNSGEKGDSIYESSVGEGPYGTTGTEGIFIDENGFIYTGGKAGYLLKISQEGKVVKKYDFPDKFKNYIKYGRICKGKDEIFFFVRQWNNFGLLRFKIKEEKFEEIPLGKWKGGWFTGHHTSTKLNSKKEILTTLIPEGQNNPVLASINTENYEIKKIKMNLEGIQRYGCVDVDENDNIYLSYTKNQKNYVGKFTPDGNPVKGENWPQIIEWYYAIQGQFTVDKKFLWCHSYGGSISRFKLNGQATPGSCGSPLISYGGYTNQIVEKDGKIYLAKTLGILVCEFDQDEEVLKPLKFIGGIRPKGITVDDKGRLVVAIGYDNPVSGEFWFFDKNKPSSAPVSNISAGTYYNPTGIAYYNKYFYSPCELNSWQKKKEKEPFYVLEEDVRAYRLFFSNIEEYTFGEIEVYNSFLYMVGQDTGKIYRIKLPLNIHSEIKNVEEVKFYKGNEEIKFNKPFGIAFTPEGEVFITDVNKLYKFKEENGKFVFEWEKEEIGNIKFSELSGICFIGEEIFFADRKNHILIRMDIDGKYKEKFGEIGVSGNDLFHLNTPTYITGEKNYIYISDSGNLRVLKLEVK